MHLQRESQLLGQLTPREAEVLAALASGRTAVQIAGMHHKSLPTIRSQIAAILSKLEVHRQADAIAIALRGAGCDEAAFRRQLSTLLNRHLLMSRGHPHGTVHEVALDP